MSTSTDLVSGLKAQIVKAEKAQSKLTKIEAKMAELEAQRNEIVSNFGVVTAAPAKRRGRPVGSGKSKGEKRGRAQNGLILPFILKHVSTDKDNPTTLMDLDAAHQKLKNPITLATRPRVIFMQAIQKAGGLFRKVAHGQYVLTAAGIKAKDGEVATKPAKAKAKARKAADTAPVATAAPATAG